MFSLPTVDESNDSPEGLMALSRQVLFDTAAARSVCTTTLRPDVPIEPSEEIPLHQAECTRVAHFGSKFLSVGVLSKSKEGSTWATAPTVGRWLQRCVWCFLRAVRASGMFFEYFRQCGGVRPKSMFQTYIVSRRTTSRNAAEPKSDRKVHDATRKQHRKSESLRTEGQKN